MNRLLPGRVTLFGAELEHVFVDGERLDTFLAARLHQQNLDGLVPAWLPWWDDDEVESQAEFEYVRSRTSIQRAATELPILLCPDDFEFSCTCVIVEVSADDDVVRWQRVGLNDTEYSPTRPRPRYIGGPVAWFPEPLSLVFDREEYLACVRAVSAGRLP